MDEFKPEDELKPDASDRRPSRPRKSSSAPKVPVSRQHMMMGIGILVLLLLVLGIGSALNGPDESKPASNSSNTASSTGSGADRNIDLTGSTSMSGAQNAPAETGTPAAGENANNAPRDVSMPAVSPSPTQAAPVDAPENQQRVTLPGDLNSALSNQQQQIDDAAQGAQNGSSLPTAPATVSASSGAAAPASRPAPVKTTTPARTQHETPHKTASKPAASESRTHTTPARPVTSGSGATKASSASSSTTSSTLPGGNYTLQLSGASRAESLNAWAKKQNLSGYHVYKTTRNGQSWYVLVSGSYATPAEAKRAVASLPADVRAQNPWVKPLSQVKKEAQ
ncbi:SPOR domain-containing protein [Pantoea sp. LMR881]|uniref:SPOR domain-containing protein n=1 Tax=Pantoea sp. LMR881 TaxID=3014336 RepID=UPI0022AF6191|nr:SPOR domain-containing protein [Pantoea sp. LMR881]MCZ4059968.1 SPOR domain-containing protein [Pantoea sp. LMR881]